MVEVQYYVHHYANEHLGRAPVGHVEKHVRRKESELVPRARGRDEEVRRVIDGAAVEPSA